MTTFDVGRKAERAAAGFLEARGYYILQRNWRTRHCEIDIVAQKAGTVYFCEVKYRASSRQGDGLAYITPQKLRRMAFAAQYWTTVHTWAGGYQLSAIAVGGPDFRVERWISDVQ